MRKYRTPALRSGRQLVDVRGSGLVQLAQDFRALFFRRPPKRREGALGGRNRAPCVFLIAQRDAGDYLTVGRLDDVHDFAAVGIQRTIRRCSVVIVLTVSPVAAVFMAGAFPYALCVRTT